MENALFEQKKKSFEINCIL